MNSELFEETLTARGAKRRVAALRALTRRLVITRAAEGPREASDVGDTRSAFDVLRLLQQANGDRKSIKICFFLLTLQLTSRGYERLLRHQNDEVLGNSIAQQLNDLAFQDSRSVLLRGFFVKQTSTLLSIVGKRETAENLLSSLLDEMHEQGYPVLKKMFFGKSRALTAFNDSIFMWQAVFSAMRRMEYTPMNIEHLSLLFIGLKSENVFLQRHACAIIRHLAGNPVTDGGLYTRIIAYVDKSEAEDNTSGFPLLDSLCRSYILQMLSRFANNESGVGMEELSSLYTRIYGHIEYIDSPDRAKSVADRVQHLVDTSRSWPLKVALASRDNNIFSATVNLLTMQIETMNETDMQFPIVLRAVSRLGRFFVRKHTEYDSHAADRRHLNNDIKDYYSITELCRHLNSKVSRHEITSHAYLRHPHILSQALVSLSWLCPTDDRVSLAESRGVTDEFWESLQRKFNVSVPYIGLEGCLFFVDNLFRRMELSTLMRFDTGSSEVTWTEICSHHQNIYLALCNMSLEVLSQFPCARTVQMTHNLWAWSDAMLRQNHHHVHEDSEEAGAAKRALQDVFVKCVALVISRDFCRPFNSIAPTADMGAESTPVAIRDLKDYGVWILAEQALLWVEMSATEGNVEILNSFQVALATIGITRSSLSHGNPDNRNSFRALMKMASRISSEDTLHCNAQYRAFRDYLECLLLMHSPSHDMAMEMMLNPLALASSQVPLSVGSSAYEYEIESERATAALSHVHSCIDNTWTSLAQFKESVHAARTQARETQEEKVRYIKNIVEAREKAATEYRTYKAEDFVEKSAREDMHAHFLSVRSEEERKREEEKKAREEEAVAEQRASQPPEVEVSHDYYLSALKEKEKRREMDRLKNETEKDFHLREVMGPGVNERGQDETTSDAVLRGVEAQGDTQVRGEQRSGEHRDTQPATEGGQAVWYPSLEQKSVLDGWFRGIDRSSNNSENHIAAAALVRFLGKSREYLGSRRIGLEQLRALWNIVDAEKVGSINREQFYKFVRLLMIACAGRKPSMEFYHATASNRSIPLPPLRGTPVARDDELLPPLSPSLDFPARAPAPAPVAVVWTPDDKSQHTLASWYSSVCAAAQSQGLPNNRTTTAAFLGTCGMDVGLLKRIWAQTGLNEEGVVYEDVNIDKFTVLVRMISLTLRGVEPTIQNYRATAADHSISLPKFGYC